MRSPADILKAEKRGELPIEAESNFRSQYVEQQAHKENTASQDLLQMEKEI